MENTNDPLEFAKVLEEFTQEPILPGFRRGFVDKRVIQRLIDVHQSEYVKALLQATEELNLMKINVIDFSHYSPEVQKVAILHAKNIKYSSDPDYFKTNSIDRDLMLPIQIAQVIENKREEAKTLSDKAEYYFQLVKHLEFYLSESKASSLLDKIKAFIKS